MFLGMFELVKDFLFFVGYVSSGTSFPKPLPKDEEKICIEKMVKGSTEAKNKLIEHNLRLVAHVAKKYHNSGIDNDDLISIGTIGLIKGVSTFSPEKNSQLASYIAKCVDNEVLMALRTMKKRRGEVSINDPIGSDKEGNEISLLDIIGTDGDIVENQVESQVESVNLYNMVSDKLSNREIAVIKMRYGLNNSEIMTQKQVAVVLKISRSYVSRIEKKALDKLYKEYKVIEKN